MTESFVIQSDIANLPLVEERLFHFCHENNVGNYYSAVSVAVMQAVKNAIVHGNASDSSKKVSLTFDTCRGGICAEVSDEGRGFDFRQYGDLPSGDSTTGEGIFIMKSLSDRMVFSDEGRMVRLEFDVAGIDPSDALERVAILQGRFAPVLV
jgi:serine/threonine-protein kinase RsbW